VLLIEQGRRRHRSRSESLIAFELVGERRRQRDTAWSMPVLFMIVERFKDNDMLPIYNRVRGEGRMIPEGLKYIDSWIEPNFSRCFQLMECDDLRLLQEWILNWRGHGATFEIVPVVSSKETREVVAPYLDSGAAES
jgi:hypothetical protein